MKEYVSSIDQDEKEFNYYEYAYNVQKMLYNIPEIREAIEKGKLNMVSILQEHDLKDPNDISKCRFLKIKQNGEREDLNISGQELQELQVKSTVGIE